MPGDRSELLGLEFERARMPAVVARCLSWCLAPRASHVVITANASHLCMMRRDQVLRQACQAGDMALADGMSVVWALGLLGRPVPERVTGIDLMTGLLEAGAAEGLRVYFMGARHEVVEALVELCRRRYPGLVVAGYRDGYFGPDAHQAIAEEIRACAPHFLFVGMPSPFKETWVERYRDRLAVPVIIGVGGSFDVLAGYIQRAPVLAQRLGLEWAWRLIMEPRKLWKRYLSTNSEFLWLVGRELVTRRIPGHSGSTPSKNRSADTSS